MRFRVKAVSATGEVVGIDIDARDATAAEESTRQRGMAVLTVERSMVLAGIALTRQTRFPTMLFSLELLTLLKAGLNVVEAIQTLAEQSSDDAHKDVLEHIYAGLQRGDNLSRSLGQFPQHFSPLYLATIQSSERTGSLRESLERYVAYETELGLVRKKIVAALLYPAILSVVGTLVLGFLMLYVVPRFAGIYDDISTPLPLFSRLLLAVGRWTQLHSGWLVLLFAALCCAVAYALARPAVRARLLAALWRIPSLGERMRIYQLARFYRTAGMLLRAGIPAVQSLRMVSGLMAASLNTGLDRAIKLLSEGRPISFALTSSGLTTPVANRMLAVGERGGEMGDMMENIAHFYDEQTARFVDAFTRVFEPVLMAVLGVAVGLVVVLMYMPIFELAGALQ